MSNMEYVPVISRGEVKYYEVILPVLLIPGYISRIIKPTHLTIAISGMARAFDLIQNSYIST